ncbi:hypothetical protein scyTo_0015666 [Scyliorhinus torazame]|uniref:mRNA decay factor PAT1 domain-containing protein n=1 Tax=Scyliorhinus torazame TaxID=75743 RepID=A0A401PWB3_SCYTO|nr:hypothetical protein [Scyliorhinus torazame]
MLQRPELCTVTPSVIWRPQLLTVTPSVIRKPELCTVTPSVIRRPELCTVTPSVIRKPELCTVTPRVIRRPELCTVTPSVIWRPQLLTVTPSVIWRPELCTVTPRVIRRQELCTVTPRVIRRQELCTVTPSVIWRLQLITVTPSVIRQQELCTVTPSVIWRQELCTVTPSDTETGTVHSDSQCDTETGTSLDESPIEEDEEALREEDHDIDQFNEDTFGTGAVEDWEEQHEGLDDHAEDPDDLLKENNLAESISKLVIDSDLEDPAIMRAIPSNPPLQAPPRLNASMWDGPMVFGGIGNPFLSHLEPSILCPTPVHVRAPIHQRFSAPFNERMSPTQLLNLANSSLRAHHFQGGVTQMLNPLLLGTAQQQTGRMSPSHFARMPGLVGSQLTAMKANLLQSRMGQMMPPVTGFRPYFSPATAGHLQDIRSSQSIFRADTTHLHPQHRRLLNQRLQLQNSRKLEKKQAALDLNSEGPKKERTKLITPQVAKLEHTYRPVQFEGSLGKLTVSSVNNPRKMIDAVVTTRTDDDTYSLVLEVQDLEKKFLQVSEAERPAVLEQRKSKIIQMYENLRGKQAHSTERVSDDHFVQIMCIRKGKRLAAKVLHLLSTEQAANVVLATARNLPYLVKKDSQDEFGLTLFYVILSQGERLQSSEAASELMQDNRWTELVFAVTRELLKVPQASLAKPLFVPTNLLALFSHYVDRQTLNVLESKLQLSGKPR